ncbi:phBC6A51 family helix-turn-helix protein [Brevibacillus laterosporus]|uniref:phBC6A51 family helix-turn-helix protein n=1 Tax=Brevibacillus laterosporus TaxID=1465 RepID=UPI00215B9778|nr:phBC6A51 family helix-turn-helix protein [Brevibacillus laterosporus]MCR8939834.1 phBC6A51 family helix-turn-helix protein [Brevibacillus laterosporus]MCZ0842474.1 phBC6A51 family helix-turn-helix protein [Brevibacillus laterosporus]MCZ0847861.1 phBC6A51 family helix-turn-helix protein [Brevibacillus laterosporus]
MAKRLTPEQYIAIGYLAQPQQGGKTIAEIAKECNVSERTIYNWKNDSAFEKELIAQMRRNVRDVIPAVNKAMFDTAVKEGNAAAAKLLFQQVGLLTDKVEVETKATGEVPDIDELKRMVAEMDE